MVFGMTATQSLKLSAIAQIEQCQIGRSVPTIWASLIPTNDLFSKVDLSRDKISFGRSLECDLSFSRHNIAIVAQQPGHRGTIASTTYKAISNFHFVIERDPSDLSLSYITDTSMNGTYVNGERILKNVRVLLSSGDEIGICFQKYSIYTFLRFLSDGHVASSKFEMECEEVRNRYVVSKLLGKGAYGEVRLILRKNDCAKFALKIVKRKQFPADRQSRRKLAALNKEVEILKLVSHPCIVSIEDVHQTNSHLYMVLDYVGGGELFDKLVSSKHLSEKYSKHAVFQVALALEFTNIRCV
ncbi:hypothetical protein ACOME3_003647 [Neoechinorhynchus agilis]